MKVVGGNVMKKIVKTIEKKIFNIYASSLFIIKFLIIRCWKLWLMFSVLWQRLFNKQYKYDDCKRCLFIYRVNIKQTI